MSGIFNNNGNNGMTDIFFAAKTNKERIPSQILANIIQNQASKIYYINPAESCTEYAQMKDDEVEEILDVAEGLEKFDYIVIDFLGEFNKRVLDILKRSRKVVFPYLSHNLAIQKMNVFIDELKRLKQEETLMKTVFVENMAQQSDSRYDEIKIAYNENYINISNILKNYGMGFNDVEPIIRQI
jgi:MinD-like ATPase involved in chromosome partitioning or flagellar assembly